jgi:hypothetical protein
MTSSPARKGHKNVERSSKEKAKQYWHQELQRAKTEHLGDDSEEDKKEHGGWGLKKKDFGNSDDDDLEHPWGLPGRFCGRIERYELYGNGMILANALYALWVGLKIDLDDSENPSPELEWVELAFGLVFLLEWVIRFTAFRKKCNLLAEAVLLKRPWFCLDTVLVAHIVVEIAVYFMYMDLDEYHWLQSLRVLRVIRVCRAFKLLQYLPSEAGILADGLGPGLRSAASAIVLLVAVLYVFGTGFCMMLGLRSKNAMAEFSSLPESMYFLFLSAALGDDITSFASEVKERSLFMTLTLFILVVLANQVIVSLLGGLMVDIIGEGMKTFREQERKRIIEEKLDDVIEKLDRIHGIHAKDDKISGEEYTELVDLMEGYDKEERDNNAGYSEDDELTMCGIASVALRRISLFLKKRFERYFPPKDTVTERNGNLSDEEKRKLAGRMEDLLEDLDVDLDDLKNINEILFPSGSAKDISAKDFKNYFSAWCFKLQKPTTYRDVVHLQKSIDLLQQNHDLLLQNQESMMKRINEQADGFRELKQSMLLELQRSFEQLRVDLAVDAGTKLKGRPYRLSHLSPPLSPA